MTAKEKKIREAYGEYWESVKDFVDENGWCSVRKKIMFDSISVNIEMQKDGYHWRPKSLQGIENNNGWLPYVGNSIGYLDIVYTDKENIYPYAVYINHSPIYEIQKITRYQPITIPAKPIY